LIKLPCNFGGGECETVAIIKAIVCEVMRDEWLKVNDKGIETVFLEQGLHSHPEVLHQKLQEAIDLTNDCDTIILGYGLCSNALIGLQGKSKNLVIPLVEDCIGLFLGSSAAHAAEHENEPGTYYFTKGWVVAQKDPYQDYLVYREKWDEEDAWWATHEMMKHYKRAVYIDTNCYDASEYFAYTREFAEFFKLRAENIIGSLDLIRELISADWHHCLILAPGEQFSEVGFREAINQQNSMLTRS